MSPFQTLLILVFWIVPIMIGALIGRRKGRLGAGLVLGLIIGWIGVIIVACLRPTRDEQIRREIAMRAASQSQQPWQSRVPWPPQQQPWQPDQGQQPSPPSSSY